MMIQCYLPAGTVHTHSLTNLVYLHTQSMNSVISVNSFSALSVYSRVRISRSASETDVRFYF